MLSLDCAGMDKVNNVWSQVLEFVEKGFLKENLLSHLGGIVLPDLGKSRRCGLKQGLE